MKVKSQFMDMVEANEPSEIDFMTKEEYETLVETVTYENIATATLEDLFG